MRHITVMVFRLIFMDGDSILLTLSYPGKQFHRVRPYLYKPKGLKVEYLKPVVHFSRPIAKAAPVVLQTIVL